MRVLLALSLIAFGLAGAGTANAHSVRHHANHYAIAYRGAPLLIYQYEPGVSVRSYWRTPWRHRHYYPTTGSKPEIGRDEDLSAAGSPPQQAESFHRSWSASSAIMQEQPREPAPSLDETPAAPRIEPAPRGYDRNPNLVKP
ncbi:MAG TPA: hypothetical protein VHV56_12755 [Pseudolabrys sp.]|jgi:hypothetical protein|nr:hypothetical protein [Pseudolabrys sp.]